MGQVRTFFTPITKRELTKNVGHTPESKLLTLYPGCARKSSGQLYRELTTVRYFSGLFWKHADHPKWPAYGDLNLIVSCVYLLSENAPIDKCHVVRLSIGRRVFPIDLN